MKATEGHDTLDPGEAQLSWAERIRRSGMDGFALECQPVLDLQSNRVTQYELLVRMHGEDGELIPPGAFLDSAEQDGLAPAIDRWVATEAIRVLALQRERGNELCLQVNVSGGSVGDPVLPRVIEREIATTGIDPAGLIFEVAESVAIAAMEETKELASELAKLGCRFALDDFGSGLGSFSLLKHLAVDYLKVDGGLVARLAEDGTDQLVVEAIAKVARGLGKQTIAEWVSDDQTLGLLRDYGIDYAQGHHIGRPTPITTLWPETQRDQPE